MTISREEIRMVRATVRHGSHVTMSSRTIEMLCDAAERGAEVTVTENMIEAALSAYYENKVHGRSDDPHKRGYRTKMCAALMAAITHRPTPEEAGK